MKRVTKLTLGFAALSLLIPRIIYEVPYLIVMNWYWFFGMKVNNGLIALSYFGSIPIVGFFLYLSHNKESSQSKESDISSDETLIRAKLAEYLGLLLLLVLYFSMMVNIYASSNQESRPEVIIPIIQNPITSVALWFCGIMAGYVISLLMNFIVNKIKLVIWIQ